jgi:hypothetical protein
MVTLKVKENSKQVKAFLELAKMFSFVEVVSETKKQNKFIQTENSPYNPEFVAMIKEAEKTSDFKTVDPTSYGKV